MSLCAHGMAGEFEGDIAVNCIWPRTAIWVSSEFHIFCLSKLTPAVSACPARSETVWAGPYWSWPGVGNPTKKTQLKSNKSNKMLGFLLGFLKTPTPNSDHQCWVFLLGFSEDLFDSCWVFGSFVGFLLGFWLICWIFVGSRSLFNFILERIFVYFKYEIFYRGSSWTPKMRF